MVGPIFSPRPVGGGGTYKHGPDVLARAVTTFGPGAQVMIGETWSFQTWYSDAAGPCGNKQNFSSAIAVTFSL